MAREVLEHAAGAGCDRLPSSLELAFLGDTVYDLYVRSRLVEGGGGRMKSLNAQASAMVCAHAQAAAFARIEPSLTDEEAAVARRARNAHQTPPRNADPAEYHRATALEAVIGHLYLRRCFDRIDELIRSALEP